MKKSNIYKFILSIFLIIGISFTASALDIVQDTTLTKKEQKALKKEQKRKAKEEKKAQREALEKLVNQQANAAIDSQSFVLEATQLYDRRGRTVNVQSNINFLKVEGNTGVLQIGSAHLVGWNGVGGITVDGRISDWKVTKDEKTGRTRVEFNIMGSVLTARVAYDLDGTGNFCNATVNGVFSNSQLKMRGQLVPNKVSSTFEGMIRY
ncbi:DUF4251 domain-containing protein [Flammeovirga yaeyamensis]|uniref:DUF4251 domain-containing protein n=1 Tax=Flammeovirga yaeyamensis TaxID=367791 RepID=A0AAX1N9U9_9BACT|nr:MULTISPECIES: DUF4251 domain-containing protein [Flammeovirga]ANQ49322.1 DUF4251 domain-containing protein [Flammeovirga sp. MY04]MBB3697801.1 hypothetical protein [Flammeovirga yaeyamensis]NMF35843.1 DUF4251 domain-containing protein [Flammeovirga yaeyamensis]QWG03206.1 DUF4251 domain-containing protein [Flammeovirga yaeyamensis]